MIPLRPETRMRYYERTLRELYCKTQTHDNKNNKTPSKSSSNQQVGQLLAITVELLDDLQELRARVAFHNAEQQRARTRKRLMPLITARSHPPRSRVQV